MTGTMARPRKDKTPKAETGVAANPPPGPPGADGGEITTCKIFKRMAKKLNQVGALLDLSQPETLARYERFIDEDLMRELTRRQEELRG